jgi:hypothetical protein
MMLRRHDVTTQSYDVLIVDDITSYLDHRLVSDLHRQGRRILGVYDSAHGRSLLHRLDADATLPQDAPADELLTAVAALVACTDACPTDTPPTRCRPPTARTTRLLGLLVGSATARVIDPAHAGLPHIPRRKGDDASRHPQDVAGFG